MTCPTFGLVPCGRADMGTSAVTTGYFTSGSTSVSSVINSNYMTANQTCVFVQTPLNDISDGSKVYQAFQITGKADTTHFTLDRNWPLATGTYTFFYSQYTGGTGYSGLYKAFDLSDETTRFEVRTESNIDYQGMPGDGPHGLLAYDNDGATMRVSISFRYLDEGYSYHYADHLRLMKAYMFTRIQSDYPAGFVWWNRQRLGASSSGGYVAFPVFWESFDMNTTYERATAENHIFDCTVTGLVREGLPW